MSGPALTRRAVLGGTAAIAAAPAVAAPGALRRQRLWYRQPAQAWTEALPVGNGRLGAMVFGGTGHERLQLNESSLWSGGPYDPVNPNARATLPEVRRLIAAGRFAEAEALANARVMATPLSQMSYQPVGDLLLDMPGLGAVDSYERELDLAAAVTTTRFAAGGVRFKRAVVASSVDQLIAIEVSASRPGAIDLDVALTSPQVSTATAGGQEIRLSGQGPAENGVAGAVHFAARVHVRPRGGTLAVAGDRLVVRGADAVTILVAIATNYRRFDDLGGDPEAAVAGQIYRTNRRSFRQIARDSRVAHARLFERVALDLGRTPAADRPTDERIRTSEASDDPDLAALYFDYGRYLLISSSQPGGLPANLQGLWNDSTKPPWGSKYTININTEMNYWPAEPTALPECVEPLVRMVRELAVTGARTARAMYGARGWVAHHNTDGWRATAPIDGAQYGL